MCFSFVLFFKSEQIEYSSSIASSCPLNPASHSVFQANRLRQGGSYWGSLIHVAYLPTANGPYNPTMMPSPCVQIWGTKGNKACK